MNIAKIIILCLMFGGFVLNCAKHGEEKGKYNCWTSLTGMVLAFFLYKWAGLWDGFLF